MLFIDLSALYVCSRCLSDLEWKSTEYFQSEASFFNLSIDRDIYIYRSLMLLIVMFIPIVSIILQRNLEGIFIVQLAKVSFYTSIYVCRSLIAKPYLTN